MDDQRHARRAFELRNAAEVYAAYAGVHAFVRQPFTSQLPESLFHAARMVINRGGEAVPFGVSVTSLLYTLAKQGRRLRAYKTARYALDRIHRMRVPAEWRDQMDVAALAVQSKPPSDREELLPVCFRCNTVSPLINNSATPGDACVACTHPFVRCALSWDVLPLVEFVPEVRVQGAATHMTSPPLMSPHASPACFRRPRNR